MSPSRQPSHNSLKPLKLFHLTAERPWCSNSSSIEFLIPSIICCFLISISLVLLYSSSSSPTKPNLSPTRWLPSTLCPQCRAATVRSPDDDDECGIPHWHTDFPGPTNLSHLVFGIGGSVNTWYRRNRYSELWWDRTTTRGYVWLDQEPPTNFSWPDKSPPYRVSSGPGWLMKRLGSYKTPRPRPSSDRIARIVKESFEVVAKDDEVRWFVMGDDDTVFFKENLVEVLLRYDHRQMWYVGGVSESVEQDVLHSYGTAFGGGGFAVSYPLACELARVVDGCVDRYRGFYGSDEKVAACVSEIGVPLTKEPGFHQLDIRDDAYGFLAAHPIAPLVSLHHLDDVKPLFPNQTQLESLTTLMRPYKADPSRTLQQSFCFDKMRKWSISISWGYTVQLYPSLVTARELETPLQTFRTWRSWSDGPFVFNTRPLKRDPCEHPIVYYLDQVEEVGKGMTVTSYRKAVGDPAKSCDRSDYKSAESTENIVVTAQRLDAQEWMEAPRRQCCEVTNGRNMESIMRVTLRSCKPGETIST
ncbi:hypothetical protein Dimus_033819 [Dionaea muscipula]